jgi:hypothetical protein
MQEQGRPKGSPSNPSTIRPANPRISNLNSALLFLYVAQEEFSSNSVIWSDIEVIAYLLTQTRDSIQTEHDKGPKLASALLPTSVLEESTSIRWNRLTIANDAADLLQQTEALQRAGIQFIVGTHKPWKQRSWELWLMVPSKYYAQAVACLGALPQKSNCIIMGGWAPTGNVEQ